MFAADPGEIADAMTELLQKVSETVASQQRLFPWLNGNTVMPSGRILLLVSKPTGSSREGTPAVARDLFITSFM